MSGLFGFLAPGRALAGTTGGRMAAALRQDARSRTVSAELPGACIGAVDRGVLAGSCKLLSSVDGTRQAIVLGAVLGFRGEAAAVEPEAAAQRCFAEPLDPGLLARAVGSFAAAIHDRAADRLELVSDPNGSLPLYYARASEGLYFAGQIKALLAARCVAARLDPLGVAMMLQLGWLGDERSLLDGIRVLPPATIASFDARGLALRRYATQVFAADPSCDWDDELERLGGLLRRAVARAHSASDRIGVPLSGGLDSRTLLALCPEPGRVPSFTFGTADCQDFVQAPKVARALGSPHHALRTEPGYLAEWLRLGVWLSEGETGGTHLHFLPHIEAIARVSDTVLDGIAGGQLIGGTYVRPEVLRAPDLARAGDAVYAWLGKTLPGDVVRQLGTALVPREALDAVRGWFEAELARSPGSTTPDRVIAFLHEQRTRRFGGVGARLLRWRLGVLAPFYDGDVLAEIARLPHGWRGRDRFYVALVKHVAPRAARVPWAYTGLPLDWPFPLAWLAMAGQRGIELLGKRAGLRSPFAPRDLHDFPGWFRGPLRPFVEAVLLDERALERGLVPADLLRRLVREGTSGERDHSALLGVLLALEIFCRDFVDDFESALAGWSGSPRLLGSPAG